jgi:hypothetical protein
MAQVNSSPGQNQVFGNAVVASGRSQPGSVDQETKSNAIVVPYTQSEPGTSTDTNQRPKRM